MTKRSFSLALALLLALLPGCSAMLNRTYRAVSPHLELVYTPGVSGQEITSYTLLLRVVKDWVRGGSDGGALRFTNYDGSPEDDMATVISEVMYNDPYGYYVGAYIVYETAADIGGRAINLSIKYMRDRPAAELAALTQAGGREALRETLRGALHSYAPYIAVQMPFYDEQFDPEGLIAGLYTQYPLYALGPPSADITFYLADKSQSRIIEFRFAYALPQDVLSRLQAESAAAFAAFFAGIELPGPPEQDALTLHGALAGLLEYDADTAAHDAESGGRSGVRPYSIAGPMLDGKAVGEGYALAYKALADAAGVEALVVFGELAGAPHAWNMARLGGDWYHIDVSMDDAGLETTHERFLNNDETMRQNLYRWDATRYPVCESDAISYDSLTAEPPEETEPPDETEPPED
jgi:hypothetical protein